MSERYSRLFTLETNQYAAGSPVMVRAGTLLKDTVTGKVLAQLKFKNIGNRTVKALKISLILKDAAGREMPERVQYQYLDLDVRRDVEFGQKQGIFLPDPSIRAYDVVVDEVIFGDNSVYSGSGEVFAPLPAAELLDVALGRKELVKQYVIACGEGSRFVPKRIRDLWCCTCGYLNRDGEAECHHCGRTIEAQLAAMEPEWLNEQLERRLAQEAEESRLKYEAAVRAAAKKRKRRITAAVVVSAILAFAAAAGAFVWFWLLPYLDFKDAVVLVESGRYEEARTILTELDGFGKSDRQLAVLDGVELLNQGDFDGGVRAILAGGTAVTVNYDAQGGTVPESGKTYLTESDFPGIYDAQREGYRFVQWKYSSFTYKYDQLLMVGLRAVWSDEFLIDYELNGGEASNPGSYRNNGNEIALKDPVREGYTFLGWTGTGLVRPTRNYVVPAGTWGNLEFAANWEANTYTVTLDGNGGSVEQTVLSVVFGEQFALPTPQRSGYVFTGWYNQGKRVEPGLWSKADDSVLRAEWKAIEYTVTYQLNGGTNSGKNPGVYTMQSGIITLQAPTKNGYKFLGWYGDADFTQKVTTIDPARCEKITLYAKWEIATYKIQYATNGGTVSGGAKTSFTINDLPVSLPSISKTGYTFLGWYNGSAKCTNWNKAESVTLTAKWEPVWHSVTYNLNGGSNSSQNPTKYNIDSGVITLKEPTKNGYKFLGWYSDSSFQNKVTQINGKDSKNVTLYAKWEIITYTITYNLNGGTLASGAKKTFTVNDLPLTLPGASKGSMAFAGWNRNDANGAYMEKLTTCENVTLYAAFMDPGLKLTLSGDKKYYTVSGYSGSASHLDIPAYYKGVPVTKIGSNAFACSWSGSDSPLVSVTIPNTITSIGDYAFEYANLNSVTIPSSVTSIGEWAFYSCKKLKSVTLSYGLKTVGVVCFAYCESLVSVVFPDSVTSVGGQTFSGCTQLKSVVLSKNMQEIDYNMFYKCSNLTSVTIPEGVTKIDSHAFYLCKNLQTLVIPASMKNIASNAFSNCSKVTFYCRANVIPSGWEGGWNNNRNVVWGYTGS